LFIVSTLFVEPFLARYQQFYSGIELAPGHTNLAQYLTILGIPLGLIGVYVVFQFAALLPRLETLGLSVLGLFAPSPAASSLVATPIVWPAAPGRETLLGVIALVVLVAAAVLWVAGLPVVGAGAVLLLALGLLAVLRPWSRTGRYLIVMVAVAVALTMGVEVVVLQGDIGRMNTVFKFYIQVWLLLAIGAAVLVSLLARRLVGSPWLRAGWRKGVAIGLGVLLCAAAIYPLLGSPSRLQHRFGPLPLSLDGMAYMTAAHYEDHNQDLRLADDFDAIRWLQQNVDGSPVIAEGQAPLYHWGSRVSIYTGLPTIIGWDWHQKQQRGDFGFMVDDRLRDVAAIFGPASPDATRDLLRKYHVQYVYVGGLERAFYSADNLRKFDAMAPSILTRVYTGGVVTIYQVRTN
jgi:YYY domain-containing protein